VEIGLTGVCIDAFEKTVAELAAFLTANGPVCHPDWAEDPNHLYPCSANVGLRTVVTIEQLPSGEYAPVPGYEDYPAQSVSFVGAEMACEYFGGRLCTLEEWSRASALAAASA
jgi:formylglycine-generating enzyme required for sulfatase activity